jgi:heat shock protein HtpX
MYENLKTLFLLTILTILLVIVGSIIGSLFGVGRLGGLIGLVLAGVTNFVSYFYADKIALSAYNAQIVSEQEAPNLHRIVGDLANNAGIKKPRIAVIQSNDPNAFATGRNQDNAVVAVTTSIMQMLNEDELRGVIGHELGHVRNHDILISSVVATVAGAITYIATMGQYAAMFSSSDDNAVGIIGALAMAILAPIAASIIQLAISRSREYKADAAGASISGNPLALASALKKIEVGIYQNPMREAKATDAHMFIMNPFGGALSTLQKLFSTHPETADRINRLEDMARTHNY